MAVIGLTGHYFIATSASEEWVRHQLPDGDLLAPMSPRFLTQLAEKLNTRDDGIDVLFAASGLTGRPTLRETSADEHPRVKRANAHRENVRVFADPSGAATVILGEGLALRTEVAIEVQPDCRSRGLGARALTDARRLISPDEVLFAQSAPGNAASLRALLTAGFRPIGSEILMFPNNRHLP